MTTTITQAHEQTIHLTIHECVPSHEPREGDPHYHLFNQARERMKRQGLLKCWVCGTDQQIELHHSMVEFSLANGVDVQKFAKLYPEFGVTDDETFARFVEGEGNLTPICKMHHTGILGIHVLPYPLWQALRVWKADLSLPAQVVKQS